MPNLNDICMISGANFSISVTPLVEAAVIAESIPVQRPRKTFGVELSHGSCLSSA